MERIIRILVIFAMFVISTAVPVSAADEQLNLSTLINAQNVKFENCNMERANLLGCTEIDIHELVKSKNLKHVKVDKTIKCQIKNAYPQVQLD